MKAREEAEKTQHIFNKPFAYVLLHAWLHLQSSSQGHVIALFSISCIDSYQGMLELI